MIGSLAIGYGPNEISPEWILLAVIGLCISFAVPVLYWAKKLETELRDNIFGWCYIVSCLGLLVSAATSGPNQGIFVPVALFAAMLGGGVLMWPLALFPILIARLWCRNKPGSQDSQTKR
jgi:hypothetical protein